MTSRTNEPTDEVVDPPTSVRDRRVKPRGVLPRRTQMWLMVGIATAILGIILSTGHPQPLPRAQVGERMIPPALVTPDRVKSYEQQLAAELARQQQALTAESPSNRAGRPSTAVTTQDSMADEARRREYQSLFADSVALSRRAGSEQPYAAQVSPPALTRSAQPADELNLLQQILRQGPPASVARPPATGPALAGPAIPATTPAAVAGNDVRDETTSRPKQTPPIPRAASVEPLLEGTVIEGVLLNRLDGTFAGPVTCLVTTPVYSHDRQSVMIPAGARVLGSASAVQSWGDSRLAVSFHRLVMPDGRTYSLDRFKGLSQIGDTGLKDSVNRHYAQVFGASLAIGALSGLAQYGSRGVGDETFADSYRQSAGSSLAASTGRILDRYLNVLPTITIREGYRIKVYLTNDLELPTYEAVSSGGVR